MAKSKRNIGAWAFLIGVVLAVIIGILSAFMTGIGPGMQKTVLAILIIAGIVIGVMNVSGKESLNFLLAALALVIVSSVGSNVIISLDSLGLAGMMLRSILVYILILFIPTTIIVALKTAFAIAKD